MNASEHSKLSISKSDALESSGVYDLLVERMKELSAKTDAEVVYEAITDLLNSIIERLSTTGECLLLYTSKVLDEDYIFSHSLNVPAVPTHPLLAPAYPQNKETLNPRTPGPHPPKAQNKQKVYYKIYSHKHYINWPIIIDIKSYYYFYNLYSKKICN